MFVVVWDFWLKHFGRQMHSITNKMIKKKEKKN